MTARKVSHSARTVSQRRERQEWATELRSQGSTWVEVADAFADRYQVNPRVAFRLAHGWSQRDAADEWNRRWPDEPKTFKNFSYWEQWPAPTGYAPSLDVLARLAEIYQCSVADLVADLADHTSLDSARSTSGDLSGLWLSRYTYVSTGREAELLGEHTIRLRHTGSRLHGSNDPSAGESRLTIDLSLRGAIATGTWNERTSATGYYRGVVYHGTIQLVISPLGRELSGRWLGFGKDFRVNTGNWRLEWLHV